MNNKEVVEKLPTITIAEPCDCGILMHYRPANMTVRGTREENKELFAKGGVILTEEDSGDNYNSYTVNGTVKPFMLNIVNLRMPLANASNALNEIKINNKKADDRRCRDCSIGITEDNCNKRLLEPFVIAEE